MNDAPAFTPVLNSDFAIKPRLPESVSWANKRKTAFLAVFDGETHLVPDDPANAERRAIELWINAGNRVEDAPPDAPA
jgi:hypothetical protein